MELDELMQDTEVAEAILQAENTEKVAEILRSRGFDIDPADIENAIMSSRGSDEEMDEQELETVVGGNLYPVLWKLRKLYDKRRGTRINDDIGKDAANAVTGISSSGRGHSSGGRHG